MSVALALVAFIALGTFGLVLVLARRLKAVNEFPAVLLVKYSVIQRAGHELPSMVAELTSSSAPAGSPRQS